jgi:glycosyltransferase involved in cell wall biosynthesis
MKIGYITQYYPPEIGAASTRARELVAGLKAKGHDLYVICETPNYSLCKENGKFNNKLIQIKKNSNIHIIRTYVTITNRKSFFKRMINYLSFMISSINSILYLPKLDIIIASSPPLTVGVSGFIISKLKCTKFILDIRDLWPDSIIALGEMNESSLIRILRYLEVILYKKSNLITIAVHGFRNHLRKYEINDNKIFDLPNGTNTELFKNEITYDFRGKNNLNGQFIVLYSGNHGLAQGLNVILDAAKLTQENKEIIYVFIGDGVDKIKLMDRSNELQLTNVRFLENQIQLNMPSIISSSDIGLVPLKKNRIFLNALPSKMFEYMSCEIPIIALIEGEAKELIDNSKAGLYVEPENAIELVKAIMILYKSKKLRQKLGHNGRKFVVKHFKRQFYIDLLEQKLYF